MSVNSLFDGKNWPIQSRLLTDSGRTIHLSDSWLLVRYVVVVWLSRVIKLLLILSVFSKSIDKICNLLQHVFLFVFIIIVESAFGSIWVSGCIIVRELLFLEPLNRRMRDCVVFNIVTLCAGSEVIKFVQSEIMLLF